MYSVHALVDCDPPTVEWNKVNMYQLIIPSIFCNYCSPFFNCYLLSILSSVPLSPLFLLSSVCTPLCHHLKQLFSFIPPHFFFFFNPSLFPPIQQMFDDVLLSHMSHDMVTVTAYVLGLMTDYCERNKQ